MCISCTTLCVQYIQSYIRHTVTVHSDIRSDSFTKEDCNFELGRKHWKQELWRQTISPQVRLDKQSFEIVNLWQSVTRLLWVCRQCDLCWLVQWYWQSAFWSCFAMLCTNVRLKFRPTLGFCKFWAWTAEHLVMERLPSFAPFNMFCYVGAGSYGLVAS